MAAALRIAHRSARVLRPLLLSRRLLGYGVGAGKSGTTSLARVFSPGYRSAHEADAVRLIEWALSPHSSDETRSFVRSRDRRLWLEMESSQLLVYLLPRLAEQFPQARFVLTVRDPFAWLRSTIVHELTQEIRAPWRRLADARYGKDRYRHSLAEQPLARRGLYTLDGYLGYWAWHHDTVLEAVPPSRLLMVRTDEISSSLGRLAGFFGVPPSTLNQMAAHSGRATPAPDVLAALDPGLVADKVHAHCDPILGRLFPEQAFTRQQTVGLELGPADAAPSGASGSPGPAVE